MAKKKRLGRPPKDRGPMIKATLRIDETLWRTARARAQVDGVSFQDLVERALAAYCGHPSRRKERR